ncbi:hypothetical protein GCM10022409_05020 [Hymenobacter glaciei]|uniref:GLUG domain-containing protein n=1 Tax=Hymenobacter glaciei TaxID=877209 RepID=A0ABP7TCM9_9BACT
MLRTGIQYLSQSLIGLDTAASIDIKAGTLGNGFEYGQVNWLASTRTVEVDQVQATQAGISEALGDSYRVGIVGGLAGKIAGTEADALSIDKVDCGNNLQNSSYIK